MVAYSIYDNKAEIYQEPIFYKEDREIIDAITYSFTQEDYEEVQANEFDIFKLGEYNTFNGKFDLLESPKHLFNVQDIIKQQKDK